MQFALICLVSVSTSAYAVGDHHKDCKNCTQKTCTSACIGHCMMKDSCQQKAAACPGTMSCTKSSCKQKG